jgi:hypothetical protein
MTKILKLNGVFVCRSTLQHLTDEELSSSVHQEMRCKFDKSIEQHLRPVVLPQDFPTEDLTPDPEYFDNKNLINPDYGDTEIMPKMGDNYLSAELMLPKDGVMVKGLVTAQKRDRDGNPIGLANDNPILDTRSYCWGLYSWRTGVLVYWHTGVLAYWRTVVLSYWRTGVLVYLRTGILAYWRTGVLVYWRTGIMA